MAAERVEAEEQASRITRRELAKVCLQCLGSSALGAVCMGYSWHVTDPDTGKIFWWGGMALGYSCITIALVTAYRRGEARGDW